MTNTRDDEVNSILPYKMLRFFTNTAVNKTEMLCSELQELYAVLYPSAYMTRRKQLELECQITECNMFIMAFNHLYQSWMIACQRGKERDEMAWFQKLRILFEKASESAEIDTAFWQKAEQELQLLLLVMYQTATNVSVKAETRIHTFNGIKESIDKWTTKIDEYLDKVNSLVATAFKEFKDQGMEIANQISTNQFSSINSDHYDVSMIRENLILLHERVEREEIPPQQMMLEFRNVLMNAMHPKIREALSPPEFNKKLDEDFNRYYEAHSNAKAYDKLVERIDLKTKILNKREELRADRMKVDIAIDDNIKIKEMADNVKNFKIHEHLGFDKAKADHIKAANKEIHRLAQKGSAHDSDAIRLDEKYISSNFLQDIGDQLNQFMIEEDSKEVEEIDLERKLSTEDESELTNHEDKDKKADEEKPQIPEKDSELKQNTSSAESGIEPGTAPTSNGSQTEEPSIHEVRPGSVATSEDHVAPEENADKIAGSDDFMSSLDFDTDLSKPKSQDSKKEELSVDQQSHEPDKLAKAPDSVSHEDAKNPLNDESKDELNDKISQHREPNPARSDPWGGQKLKPISFVTSVTLTGAKPLEPKTDSQQGSEKNNPNEPEPEAERRPGLRR